MFIPQKLLFPLKDERLESFVSGCHITKTLHQRKRSTTAIYYSDLLQLELFKLDQIQSVVFRGSILLNTISDEIKLIQSITSFEIHIKSWLESCNCYV